MQINGKKITLPIFEISDIISERKGDIMNYIKIIRDDVFRGIDDTLYVCMIQAGDRAAAEADIMGLVLKRELTRYTDDAVRRIKQSMKGGGNHDEG